MLHPCMTNRRKNIQVSHPQRTHAPTSNMPARQHCNFTTRRCVRLHDLGADLARMQSSFGCWPGKSWLWPMAWEGVVLTCRSRWCARSRLWR